MSANTSIQWTDRTWNPVRGCSRVSEGCRHCYAEVIAARFSTHAYQTGDEDAGTFAGFAKQTPSGPRWTGRVELIPSKLAEPLTWRKPQRVFVNSMSDLFHEVLPFEHIAAVFGVMAARPHITFQVLTKRAARMLEWFEWVEKREKQGAALWNEDSREWRIWQLLFKSARDLNAIVPPHHGGAWPLPNVWLGVSAENEAIANERVPLLLQCPAAVRFVSYEPALEGVDFLSWLAPTFGPHCASGPSNLNWIIVGGESGPGARPFDIAWARSTVEQCRAAGVPVFVKQLGSKPYGVTDHAVAGTRGAVDVEITDFLQLRDRKGGDSLEWPGDLRVREFPLMKAILNRPYLGIGTR